MKYLYLNIILLTSVLLISCAGSTSRIKLIEISTSPYTSIVEPDSTNRNLEPFKVYPNPFSPRSNYLGFRLADSAHVRIEIYDHLYDLRLTWGIQNLPAASYELDFSDVNLDPGIYFGKLIVNGELVRTSKLFLMKQ